VNFSFQEKKALEARLDEGNNSDGTKEEDGDGDGNGRMMALQTVGRAVARVNPAWVMCVVFFLTTVVFAGLWVLGTEDFHPRLIHQNARAEI